MLRFIVLLTSITSFIKYFWNFYYVLLVYVLLHITTELKLDSQIIQEFKENIQIKNQKSYIIIGF